MGCVLGIKHTPLRNRQDFSDELCIGRSHQILLVREMDSDIRVYNLKTQEGGMTSDITSLSLVSSAVSPYHEGITIELSIKLIVHGKGYSYVHNNSRRY